MKKLFNLIPIIVLALVGCQNIELMPDSDVLQKSEFSAQVEVFDVQTKTSLGQNRMVVWSENDQIAIFQGSSLADKFQVKASSVGNSNGVFPMVAVTSGVRDHKLNFKNMFGVLKLQLKGDRVVKSISVTGRNNEVLAGNATISAYLDGSVSMSTDARATYGLSVRCAQDRDVEVNVVKINDN